MKLRTLIIDDEPIALAKLRSYVTKTPFLELVAACPSGVEAMDILLADDVDVIFTDINMPDLNGMEFIGSLTHPPLTVFITAYSEYAVESYRLNAVDYLLKPYSLADFRRAANRVLERYTAGHARQSQSQPEPIASSPVPASDSIFVKTDYRYVRINLDDIRYIKGFGEYLQVFSKGSAQPLLTLSSFAAIKERLSSQFLQVHRSYIVNMRHVSHIERARIVMDADTYIPVGDSYKNVLQSYLSGNAIGGTARKDS